MIYAVVLGGGSGRRMESDIPKQFISVCDKPILVHTIEKFVVSQKFDEILVMCPKDWINTTKDLVKKNYNKEKRITVLEGGETRNDTILNAIAYIENNGNLLEDTIIVTHDAVRPFVSERIIKENIAAMEKYDACDTVIPATDTIVKSNDGVVVDTIPDRSKLFQGQTPQTFKAKKLKELYHKLKEEDKEILTDAAKIFALNGEKVHLVKGDSSNMKITYPFDITIAEGIFRERKNV